MARNKIASKMYIDAEGNDYRSVPEAPVGLEFRFENGSTHTVKLADFPENVLAAATYHGLSQKLSDRYSGSESVEDAESKFLDAFEQLQEGDWVTVSEGGGPRVTQLVEAIREAKRAAGDSDYSDEDAAKVLEGKDKDQRTEIAAIPEVAAQLAKIRARVATERAEKMAAKTDDSDGGGLAGL